jgi:hypothetical protein
MAVQTVQNQIPTLNHYLIEAPERNVPALRTKAFAANVLAKITYVAIAAICASLLFVSLMAVVPTAGLSLTLLSLLLATPFLSIGSTKLQTMAYKYASLAETEEAIGNELKMIQEWKTPEITQFFNQHGLSLENLPMKELLKLNAEEPLCALLPLIARFQYLNRMALEQEERYKANLQFESDLPQLRIDAHRAALHKHEIEAIPTLLDASVMLRIISQPSKEWSRDEIGEIKDFQERAFDRLLFGNDDYFLFKDPNRPALKLREIEQNFNADALYLKLYRE